MLNIYATSRNINIALIKMVVPKSKFQSEDSCNLNADFVHANTTISESATILENSTARFDWNDQEQGSILEKGIFIFYRCIELGLKASSRLILNV